MGAVSKVLVVGGGFSGMSAAIQLCKYGAAVDLVEIDPNWRSYGAGITISGPTLRALGMVGVLPQVMEQGACTDACDVFTPQGKPMFILPTPRVAGPDVPGSGGVMRPILAAILADATRASGANVRLGCTLATLSQDAAGVDVTFADGSQGRYDLVIGADGLSSKMRHLVFPDAPKPQYTGQGVWRAVVPRPAEVERAAMYLGKHTKVGYNPVSSSQMYVFLTEDRPTNDFVPDDQLIPQFRALLDEFTAPVTTRIRDGLGEQSSIVYRPLEALLLAKPWSKGRVVLIGDAVHATTPHLASGAGIGIEDAVVLVDELHATSDLALALANYQDRRFERCRLVVENSVRLGEIERTGGSQAEHGQIMRDSTLALAAAI